MKNLTGNKVDIVKLDKIVKKTIEAINNSKTEIYDIAEGSRKECKRLEEELILLSKQVRELIESVEVTEQQMKDSRQRLMLFNRNFSKYTQEELKEAYEKADNIRVVLAVKREKEQQYIRRRNEIEIRLKEAYKTVQKAENLITQVGAALGYLSGDLLDVSSQLEDLQQRQFVGLRIIKAQEDERQRVARDIHDGPAQSMSNVVLKAEFCEKLIDVDLERTRIELQNLKKSVRECLQDVRKIIYNLRPMSLDDLGLVPTLQRFILTIHEETGIALSFKTIGVFDGIKSAISLTVFRIVQEATSNIVKHALAQNVAINLEFMDKQLKLFIYDDGNGFDVEKLKVRNDDISSGFGLLGMRERIDLLGGELVISSAPGKGTRLNITIPYIQEEGVCK